MDELLALFRFLVPYFATVPDADVERALALAEPYRPACLTPEQQDEAQVYYAANLLYQRSLQLATGGSGQPAVPVGVKSEKEGDLQRTYGAADGIDTSDPFGWRAEYDRLAAACGGGAITVGTRWRGCCPGPFAPPCC